MRENMQHFLSLLTAVALLLSACTFVPPEPPASIPRMEEADEETRGSGEKVTERLLPNGVLEIGERDTPITLLVATEHHCRYCREFHWNDFPSLMEKFADAGKLRVQIVILPLKKYAGSDLGAKASLCAAQQNAGLRMHDHLFSKPEVSKDTVMEKVKDIGMDEGIFLSCLDDLQTSGMLASQRSWLRTLDVNLVPTFFLNGEKSVGLKDPADLDMWIMDALDK